MGDSCGRVLEWELGLPDAGELIPLSHSLISPTLAAAFQISLPDRRSPDDDGHAAGSPISHLSWEEEEGEEEEPGDCHLVGGGSRGGRGQGGGKKPRMVWTPELHHRFVAAVAHLGPKGAVPKAIVQLMNVEGLTRENVASHLQKYRLYLKRMPANSGTSSSAMRGDQSSPPPAPQEEQRPVPRIGGWASHSALAPFAGVGHCHQPPLSAGQHVTGYYAYDFSWPRAKNVDCDSEQLLRWLLGNDSLLVWLLTILTFMVLCCKNGQPRLVKGLTDKACVILLHICLAVVPSSRRLLHFLNSVTAMIFCRKETQHHE